MEEIWKDVVGYEGLYQVSNLGRVRSTTREVIHSSGMVQHRNGKILSVDKGEKGYLSVYLYREGKKKFYGIHRLVAQAFLPNPNNLPQVNHKDENTSNNMVENLEWCTRKYNVNYGTARKRGLATKRAKNSIGAEIPVLQYELDGKFVKRYDSSRAAERETETSSVAIRRCCVGKYRQNKGFLWIYERDIETLEQRLKDIRDNVLKRFVQLSLEGEFIKLWNSATIAERTIGIRESSIRMCADGKYKTAGGFKWMRETNYLKLKKQ